MTQEQLQKLLAQLDGAISQAGIEGAWMTHGKLATIKNELHKQLENSKN